MLLLIPWFPKLLRLHAYVVSYRHMYSVSLHMTKSRPAIWRKEISTRTSTASKGGSQQGKGFNAVANTDFLLTGQNPRTQFEKKIILRRRNMIPTSVKSARCYIFPYRHEIGPYCVGLSPFWTVMYSWHSSKFTFLVCR